MDSMVMDRTSSPSHDQAATGGITEIIRRVLMVLIMALSLGYLFKWTATDTKMYWTWKTHMVASTNSTFSGWRGAILILFYTSPILLAAVLGCIYLHLGKEAQDNNSRISNGSQIKPNKGMWKRQMIIKGLGIVSGTELAILFMFILLLVWSFAAPLHTLCGHAALRARQLGDEIWQVKMERVGLIFGLVGDVCLAFLFFPVTRGSSLLPIFGLTSEASIKYHIWVGHITMVLFTAHGIFYILYWVTTHRYSEMLKWDHVSVSNVAGELSLLSGLVLWVTTFPGIRRKTFELFLYTHHLYILFMLFYIFHLGIGHSYVVIPGFYLFLVDRYLRFLQSRQQVRVVSARILPCQTLELNFSKSPALRYNPTSMIFVNVPSISKLQWHPFTISSNSNLEPNTLSIIIKEEGSWTKRLYQLLSSPSPVNHLSVAIEGPCGPVSTHFLRHDMLVMVSGGSGFAPCISIIRELVFTVATHGSHTPRVLVITAFKYYLDLTMLDLILPISGMPGESSKLELRIEAYVTREKEPQPEKAKTLQTLWFEPNPSDVALSSILGPNSWLWLGAIITSSFIIFLLLIGIITRYYIYPIDHNTNRIYSEAAKSAMSMTIVCISIAMAASYAFMWSKKQNAKEAVHIENTKDVDKELESLPAHFLVKSTNVHYAGRPDLKRILLECKDPSVGVLVCGPKTMRHDVAAICSSGFAENLHFESISYSW